MDKGVEYIIWKLRARQAHNRGGLLVPTISQFAAVSCLLSVLAVSPLEGKELEDQKWIEVSTEHL